MTQRSREQAKPIPKADVHPQNPSLGGAAYPQIGSATEQPTSPATARATPSDKVEVLTAAEGPSPVSLICEVHDHN